MGGIAHIYNLNNSCVKSRKNSAEGSRGRSRMLDIISHRQPVKPIPNEDDSKRILFSGRLYNKSKLLKLFKGDHNFTTEEDAEIVLHLYEKMGEKILDKLEGVYAFAIYSTGLEGDDRSVFIARDPLGVAPLYISENEESVCIASEFKALGDVVPNFREFPIGSYYRGRDKIKAEKRFVRYHSFSRLKGKNAAAENRPSVGKSIKTLEDAEAGLQTLLNKAVIKRIDRSRPFGVYLSGGLDSSIIAALAVQELAGVNSFAVGMEGSQDLLHARLCAQYLGTKHHEYTYSLDEMLEVLPTVIYHLESYDAALVRSSVPNYFLARMASELVEVVLSGEGADELFCGYTYMQSMTEEERRSEAYYLLETMYGTGLQRADRMSAAFGLKARVPFLDLEFVQYALRIPDSMKYGPLGQEKWVLRKAFSHLLPEEIVSRKKKKFSEGTGSFELLSDVAEQRITDGDFYRNRVTAAGRELKSKEELFYYRIFHDYFPQRAAEETVGFSRSL